MKYQKKPVIIEANQFLSNNEPDNANMNSLVEWINSNGGKASHDGTSIYIETLEGRMRSEVGDFIIKGIKGEFYSCKEDIFYNSYSPYSK